MKKQIILIVLIGIIMSFMSCATTKTSSVNNMIAVMEVDEPIPGVCNNSRVIVILPLAGNGQIKAKPSITDEEIQIQLNEEVVFLQENPNYNDKGMVALIVNCEGEMVRCKMDNKTKSEELDKQIVAVFSQLKKWEPGSVKGEDVDTLVLYSFTIENGKIIL